MDIYLLPISFLAGVLTILAPCVLPLLPVIIGGSVAEKSAWRPFFITISLAVSVTVFTLLLRASQVLIDVPASFWSGLSGGIILFFGFITLFPHIWEMVSMKLGFGSGSQKLLTKAQGKKSAVGAVLMGAALGPVFASCSPTYAVILGIVLPRSFSEGVVHIITYSLGLAVMMFLIAFFGQKLVRRLKWAANPNGAFKKVLGVLFLLVGLAIITGLDKDFEAYVIDQGWTGIFEFEENLTEKFKE